MPNLLDLGARTSRSVCGLWVAACAAGLSLAAHTAAAAAAPVATTKQAIRFQQYCPRQVPVQYRQPRIIALRENAVCGRRIDRRQRRQPLPNHGIPAYRPKLGCQPWSFNGATAALQFSSRTTLAVSQHCSSRPRQHLPCPTGPDHPRLPRSDKLAAVPIPVTRPIPEDHAWTQTAKPSLSQARGGVACLAAPPYFTANSSISRLGIESDTYSTLGLGAMLTGSIMVFEPLI